MVDLCSSGQAYVGPLPCSYMYINVLRPSVPTSTWSFTTQRCKLKLVGESGTGCAHPACGQTCGQRAVIAGVACGSSYVPQRLQEHSCRLQLWCRAAAVMHAADINMRKAFSVERHGMIGQRVGTQSCVWKGVTERMSRGMIGRGVHAAHQIY